MKILKFAFLTCIGSFIITGCSSSTTDDFNDMNGNVTKKFFKSISSNNLQDPTDNDSITFTYDSNSKLISASNGTESSVFNYNSSGSLTNVTSGGSSSSNVEELYQSPYNAFEVGEVLEYDANGNPYKLLFLYDEYNTTTHMYETQNYTAEVTYDEAHNPYFYTLEAAGIIEVLDGVQLNLSMTPQSSEVINAKKLFPVNNPSKITYKDADGNVKGTLTITYTYDSDNYPTTATGVATSDSETSTVIVNYEYL